MLTIHFKGKIQQAQYKNETEIRVAGVNDKIRNGERQKARLSVYWVYPNGKKPLRSIE